MNVAVTGQGWEAKLRLRYAERSGATRIVERSRSGPLAVQRPFYPEGEVCHTYLLHPPGGVVGGDSLDINVDVGSGAHALITTPGATKFYRSGGRLATQVQHLRVEDGGILEWLPQENIYFPDANVQMRTQIELAPHARFIGWDLQCLGRPVIDEGFDQGRIASSTLVSVDSELVLVDQLRTEGSALVDAAAGMRGHAMQGCLIFYPGDEAMQERAREVLEERASPTIDHGVTLVDGVLVVRALGPKTEPLLAALTTVWSGLRPMLLGKEASVPRIWAT